TLIVLGRRSPVKRFPSDLLLSRSVPAPQPAALPPQRAEERALGTPALAVVHDQIVSCNRCPRLRDYCGRVAVEKKRAHRDDVYWGRAVPGFGDPAARLVIVALGKIAFDTSLRLLKRRGMTASPRPQFGHAVVAKLGESCPTLIGCYHPRRQNTNTGKLTAPMMEGVFRTARKAISN